MLHVCSALLHTSLHSLSYLLAEGEGESSDSVVRVDQLLLRRDSYFATAKSTL